MGSIHIIREVTAEFDNPVMLNLAMKAYYSGKPPFSLMPVDTTWKFREMNASATKNPRALV